MYFALFRQDLDFEKEMINRTHLRSGAHMFKSAFWLGSFCWEKELESLCDEYCPHPENRRGKQRPTWPNQKSTGVKLGRRWPKLGRMRANLCPTWTQLVLTLGHNMHNLVRCGGKNTRCQCCIESVNWPGWTQLEPAPKRAQVDQCWGDPSWGLVGQC